MAIHVALYHKTHYTYDKPVGHGPHVVRLRPAPHCRTSILSYSQKITGGEHFINWQQDPFANWNGRLVFPDPMREFCVEVELVAEMAVHNPFDFFLEDSAQIYPFAYDQGLKKELAPFMELPKPTPHLLKLVDDLIERYLLKGARTIDFLVEVNQRIQHAIKYTIRLEPGVQTPEETLTKASGSCRDSAWLLAQTLRSMGFAARFVSGYLIQLAPDLKSLDGPSGTEVDFTDLHAWCEVYLPGGGWIGLDPTSGLLAGEGHIPLSCTPEPSSAAPVTGAVDKCESKLHHEMKITRIYESPRVTKPYTEEQWKEIEKLGHAIDADLVKNDVRLTMGGEPTFISIDDPDGPEWNFTAVSHKKRVLSGELIKRLRASSRLARCCITARASGIPANPCPVTRSQLTGAKTACRSGRTIRSSPTNRRITASARRKPARSRIVERREAEARSMLLGAGRSELRSFEATFTPEAAAKDEPSPIMSPHWRASAEDTSTAPAKTSPLEELLARSAERLKARREREDKASEAAAPKVLRPEAGRAELSSVLVRVGGIADGHEEQIEAAVCRFLQAAGFGQSAPESAGAGQIALRFTCEDKAALNSLRDGLDTLRGLLLDKAVPWTDSQRTESATALARAVRGAEEMAIQIGRFLAVKVTVGEKARVLAGALDDALAGELEASPEMINDPAAIFRFFAQRARTKKDPAAAS